MAMQRIASVLLVLLLCGCSALQGTPEAPPPATNHPQEIQKNQTVGLQKIGTVSAMVYGSPMDVEEAIKEKVVAAKADYYVIVMIDDTMVPGQWYSQAILYRKP